MRIHHSRPRSGFTIIPNAALQDERLTFAARGVLAHLLSLPDGWNTNADELARRAGLMRPDKARGEGRRAMRAVFGELKERGYIRHRPVPMPGGRWGTEVEVSDIPLTDVPVTGTSVPPAETAEAADNSPELFSQVAPTYRSPGVGSPARRLTGTSVSGTPSQSTDLRGLNDEGQDHDPLGRVGDAVDDWGARGNHPREEQPIANSHKPRVHDGPVNVADDVQHDGDNHSPALAEDRNARASDSNGPANGGSDHAESPESPESSAGGAGAPLSEPAKPAR
jgi:hypothetical protein